MDYLLSFLEGIITFISPCILPMLPIYVSYFAGQNDEGKRQRILVNALGFVFGFTVVFVIMGAFAASIGRFLKEYQTAFNIFSGALVIFFGLNFMQIIKIPFISENKYMQFKPINLGFFSSVIFGMVFSIGWTPCVGAFLGSALMLASHSGESIKGVFLLLCFSLGLGIPFVLSAVLIDALKQTFDFIKKHYRTISIISGGLLIIVGILMISGMMGYFLNLLSF